MKVLAFGEILFDVIDGEHFLGGAPLNFAAHLAKLGAESYILSRAGDDALGREAEKQIEITGVKTNFIQKDSEHETGTVKVVVENGQPDYFILENVAYDYIKYVNDGPGLKEMDFDVLYFGSLAQRNEVSKSTLHELLKEKQFIHIFYDVNLRKGFYNKEILIQSLHNCSILKLNDEEVTVLGNLLFQENLELEDFAVRVSVKYNIKVVIITAGAKGCIIYDTDDLHFVKGYPAKVVDTIGAGDSFSAAFLYQYYHHGDILKAADKANQLGAFVASSRGPIPDYSPEIIKIMEL